MISGWAYMISVSVGPLNVFSTGWADLKGDEAERFTARMKTLVPPLQQGSYCIMATIMPTFWLSRHAHFKII